MEGRETSMATATTIKQLINRLENAVHQAARDDYVDGGSYVAMERRAVAVKDAKQNLQDAFNNQHAALVEQRDRALAALRQIAAYPSGYKFSGTISDAPSAGRDREEMIHLARSVVKEFDAALATVERGGESHG